MPSWDSEQYLRFSDERTRPARDLAAQVPLASVGEAFDLGCGPGNSTEVLARRWPEARLTGVDSSPSMLAAARKVHPDGSWIQADLQDWRPSAPADLLFSNAAFQWVPGHEVIFPGLLQGLRPGGVLAVQMPAASAEPALALIREVAAREPWRGRFDGSQDWRQPHPAEAYYRWLSPGASRIELWETTYFHVLGGHGDLLAWVKGTALRPYLDRLDPAEGAALEAAYLREVERAYPLQPDGRVLLPFRRLFLLAVR